MTTTGLPTARRNGFVSALMACAALLVQCSPSEMLEPSVPDFGHADPCPYTRLMNEPNDADQLSEGRACFDRTVASGTPITWDLEVITTEGDPIFHRVEWDGRQYSILIDSRADEFGRGEILTYECTELGELQDIPYCP